MIRFHAIRALVVTTMLACVMAASPAYAQSTLSPALQADFERGMELGRAGDYAGAYALVLPAAQAGDAAAQFVIGSMHSAGQSVPTSKSVARQWFEQAANAGHARAAFNLGVHYDTGQEIAIDHEKALQWFKRAADLGDAEAAYNAGDIYLRGDGVEVSLEDAFFWFRKSAEAGVPQAQNAVGYAYRHGFGVAMNWDLARDWYRAALSQDDPRAAGNMRDLIRLSIVDAYDREREGDADISRGIYADGCNVDLIQACVDLGRVAIYGKGGPADFAMARDAYGKACREGVTEGCRGEAYAIVRAPGDQADHDRAFAWFSANCAPDNPHACHSLGYMKYQPQFGRYDYDGAKRLLGDLCLSRDFNDACQPFFAMMNAENAARGGGVVQRSRPSGGLLGAVMGGLARGLDAFAVGVAQMPPGGGYYASTFTAPARSSASSGSSTSVRDIQNAHDWREANRAASSIGTGYASTCRIGNAYC